MAEIAGTAEHIRALIPDQPIGARHCALLITQLCSHRVHAVDIEDLAGAGHLTVVDHYRGSARYDANQVLALACTGTGQDLIAAHHLLGPDQASAHLDIRRVDFDHLVQRGWIEPATHVTSHIHGPAIDIALYRTGDLDDLARHPLLDWPAIRAARPGQRSPIPPRPPATGDQS